jgi:hypothetical protein
MHVRRLKKRSRVALFTCGMFLVALSHADAIAAFI